MHIDMTQIDADMTMSVKLAEDDRESAGKATLARKTVTFNLPKGFNKQSVHPDLLALAGLITFYPWIGKRLDLSFAVSQGFADTVKAASKIEIANVSDRIQKRTTGENARPGLAFSGGVDSIAALAIMPENTVPVFSCRTAPPNGGRTLYKADAPLHAIKEMNAAGKDTFLVESDLEWVREPVGFAIDPSPAVPLLLLADLFELDAIGFGTIAEAAYRTGGAAFLDYSKRGVFTQWQTIFHSVGIDYYNCVAGLSEMCTTSIALQSEFGHLAQSCVRGLAGKPCMSCVKCFRKSLIEASMSGNWPSESEVSRMMANRAIRNYLSDAPIRLEIILAAAMMNYAGRDPLLLALQKRVAPKTWNVSFTQGWYGPSLQTMVPQKYRQETTDRMLNYIPQMTGEQEEAFRSFEIGPVMAAKNREVEEFLAILEANASPTVVG
ncbi:DUF6395 domain-containing protein [Arthrobacter sp. ATA002]|uniref:DUF6395 domain-containing protein n=1 Tax=Arthrobacter sp. ATA002 TaxID=2991715 RepID=UPI0022A6FCC4|nr:DUF6395 domain-containing protein [Arthrobacter sp. ATA002]WAP52882.1 DUF6395 domain-containing protein [Arthrobacter sp. ATA002]